MIQKKLLKCNDTLIPHFTFNPNYTFGISIAVITVLLAGYGVYKGFFANQNLADPWDDHDDYFKRPMNNIGLEVVFWTVLSVYLLAKLEVFKIKNDEISFVR